VWPLATPTINHHWVSSLPLHVARQRDDQERQRRQHAERYRGAEAELPGTHRQVEGVGREQMGGVLRSAMRQHIDELEVGEGEDHGEQRDDQEDRLQQWQDYITEALESAGAVDRCDLIEFG